MTSKKPEERKKKRNFTHVLLIVVTEEMDGEIRKIAQRDKRTVSSVGREFLGTGLRSYRRSKSKQGAGEPAKKKATKKKATAKK